MPPHPTSPTTSLSPAQFAAFNNATGWKTTPTATGQVAQTRAQQIRGMGTSGSQNTQVADEDGLLGRIGSDFTAGQQKTQQELGSDEDLSSKALQTAGNAAGFVENIPLEVAKSADDTLTGGAISSALKAVIGAAANTSAGKSLISQMQQFETAHPESAANLGAVFNIAGLIPGEKAAELAGDEAGKFGSDVKDAFSKGPEDDPPGGSTPPAKAAPVQETEATGAPIKPGIIGKTANFVKGAASTAAETAKNIKDNVANFAEDAQKDRAARAAVKSQGPEAVSVVDQTGSPEFLKNIDNTKSMADLKAKAAMLDVAADHPDLGGTGNRSTLPRQVIADSYINPRISMLQSRLGQLGKTIGAAKDDVTRVNTNDLVDSMIDEAKKQGVVVTKGKAGFNFAKAPGVSGIDSARINTIKSMFEGFKPNRLGNFNNTISDLASTRKNFSDMTSRADAAKEVVSGGGAVDNARRLIAQKIGAPYHAATQDYHNIATVLEKLDPKQELKLSEEGAKNIKNIKLGDYARRLLSNNASQAKATFTSLDELAQKEAARSGKELPQGNLEDLVDTAGGIEEGLGITPRNTFFGQSSGATKDALGGLPTSVHGALGKVAEIMTKSKPDAARALKAMRAYTQKAIQEREK